MADRRVWARRIVMPLAILVVAGGLSVWNSHRRAAQAEVVQRLVIDLCDDLAALRRAVDLAGGRADALSVVVEPGDTTEAGTVGQEATHTAVIRVDGRDVLGLRVVYPGLNGDIAIIGFWSPRPS
jgi:hypothetical protein